MNSASAASEILPGLFIGNDTYAARHGEEFGLVVNCTPHLPLPAKARSVRIAVEDDPYDSVPLFQVLRDTSVLADMHATLQAGGSTPSSVLVHCQAGAQRSPAVVACYLVVHHGMTPHGAIDLIRTRRRTAFFWQVNLIKAICMTHDRVVDAARSSSADRLNALV
jgi:hypothetical protein